jgi:O-antigen/teichoic acid export membrane protein
MSFYGADFLLGVLSLRILILAQLVSAVCGSVAILLQMTDNQTVFQNIFLIATFLNIVFNILLIPKYGITGAALATLISTSFWNIGAAIYAKKKLNILTIYWPKMSLTP